MALGLRRVTITRTDNLLQLQLQASAIQATALYRVGQKSTHLPKYQYIVLKSGAECRYFWQIWVWRQH